MKFQSFFLTRISEALLSHCGSEQLIIGSEPVMIQSPAFPEYFPVQSQCQWQVTSSENLKISFMNWDMPVERDICRSVNLMITANGKSARLCSDNPSEIIIERTQLSFLLIRTRVGYGAERGNWSGFHREAFVSFAKIGPTASPTPNSTSSHNPWHEDALPNNENKEMKERIQWVELGVGTGNRSEPLHSTSCDKQNGHSSNYQF
ncbi:Oidioi.mRNA.OKI2018_I69.XSR.g15566.t1.cds [Oikopleura dioica]|uniref:Oidioi.mRNA.OKI2018_I69.XSR.g15566.t1.cds n=1 Tax=Oikopleura dioica TaxID=34765 RepID=A0ABN7SDT5_OIKDI|nr:Oidioi.mRNA.OKI2018_I69.XSR.g15566.t1.cds [Oikopleura dioica]